MIENGTYYVLNGGREPSGFTNSWNVEEKTITISEGGNSCGFVFFNKEKFYCGGHCYYLTEIDTKIDEKYLYYYLKSHERNIMRLRVGSGLPNIQKKDLNEFLVSFPSIEEQQYISEFLLKIDKKISILKNNIKLFEKLKKKLLNDLFI